MGNPNWRLQNRVTSPLVEEFWRENFGAKKALVHMEQFLAAMERVIDKSIETMRPLFNKEEITKVHTLTLIFTLPFDRHPGSHLSA
jgi:hypothetical protein